MARPYLKTAVPFSENGIPHSAWDDKESTKTFMKNKYFVYILTNAGNTVLYTGVTNDLRRRLEEHREKLVPGFTARYNVHKLVWYEMFFSPAEAIVAEKTIKGWGRGKKLALIMKTNPTFADLSKDF
jgi:putative endonuclease